MAQLLRKCSFQYMIKKSSFSIIHSRLQYFGTFLYLDNWVDIEFVVFQYFVHENYGVGHQLDNDIMLIRIEPPVEYGEFQSPVCLPHAGYAAPDDLECYTTGWGALSCECVFSKKVMLHVNSLGLCCWFLLKFTRK